MLEGLCTQGVSFTPSCNVLTAERSAAVYIPSAWLSRLLSRLRPPACPLLADTPALTTITLKTVRIRRNSCWIACWSLMQWILLLIRIRFNVVGNVLVQIVVEMWELWQVQPGHLPVGRQRLQLRKAIREGKKWNKSMIPISLTATSTETVLLIWGEKRNGSLRFWEFFFQ